MQRLKIIRKSPNKEEILWLYRKEKRSKLKERYHALYLMFEFENCTRVAELLGKHRSTVIGWVNTFNERGLEGIVPKKPPGRPSRLSEEQMGEVKKDVMTHPRQLGYEFSNWEGKSVAHHIKKKFGVEIKVRQAQNILHKLTFTLQRPRYKFPKANPEKQKEFVQELQKKAILSNPTR